MKPWIAIAAVFAVPACSHAQAAQASQAASGSKACEDLKSEIAAKLDAKDVKSYSLDIADKDKEVTEGKVVGTCEGGTKKIVYTKGSAKPEAPAKSPTKP